MDTLFVKFDKILEKYELFSHDSFIFHKIPGLYVNEHIADLNVHVDMVGHIVSILSENKYNIIMFKE